MANVCYDPTLQATRSDSGTISNGLVTCPANSGLTVYNCAVKTIYLFYIQIKKNQVFKLFILYFRLILKRALGHAQPIQLVHHL